MIPLYQRISRIIFKFPFQKVAHPVRQPNRHILEILLTCWHTLITQSHQASVRLYHCSSRMMKALLSTHWNIFSNNNATLVEEKDVKGFAIGQYVIVKYQNSPEVLQVSPGTSSKTRTMEQNVPKFEKWPSHENVFMLSRT